MIYRAISVDEEFPTTSIAGHSEFETYDLPDICVVLKALLQRETIAPQTFNHFITFFFRELQHLSQKNQLQTELRRIEKNIRKLHDIGIPNDESQLSSESNDAYNNLTHAFNCLSSKLKTISNGIEEIHEEDIIKYLDSFLNLSAHTVFQPENSNLLCDQFRESKYINQLISFASKRKRVKAPELDSEEQIDYYSFSLIDPFVLDKLYISLHAAYLLCKKREKIDKNLYSLHTDKFLTSLQESFARSISIRREKYQVGLNRHNSEIVAYPAYKLSSTENINIIRLFEKIALYIRKHMRESNEHMKIEICIIGHTETTNAGYESSLMDLVSSILYWYELLPEEEGNKPRLSLSVSNIVNIYDMPECNLEGRESFTCSLHNHSAKCKIERRDYEKEFAFSTDSIKNIIRENDMIFILDCPWLSTEIFENTQTETINNYCYRIQSQTARRWDSDEETLAYKKDSPIEQLGRQYYRLMNSNSTYIGDAVRSIRDATIVKIQEIVESENEDRETNQLKKELYLFISEGSGIKYSYVDTYPWTREERYDSKVFSIISFGNNSIDGLRCTQDIDETVFRFNLWGIIKYIDISYAYSDLRDKIITALEVDEIDSNAYFEMLRNILVILRVDRTLVNIEISVRFGDNIAACISQIGSKKNEQEARANLWKLTIDLIKPLYRDCVFSTNRNPGDEAIKNAFLMNLYSSAQDVNGMLFYHEYEKNLKDNKIADGLYRISFENAFHQEIIHGTENIDFVNTDYFRDRKLYDYLMRNYEVQQEIYYGLERMIDEVVEALKKSGYIIIRTRSGETLFLQEIAKACEKANRKDTTLYKNIRAKLARNRT